MSNLFYAEVTQGDPRNIRVAFKNLQGNAQDLTGWQFHADFKEAYSSSVPEFSLVWNNQVKFLNDDPTTGIVIFRVSDEMTAGVTINTYAAKIDEPPFKQLVGDIKIIPPGDVELEVTNEQRPTIILKVWGAITND